jgi:hypothetical protein
LYDWLGLAEARRAYQEAFKRPVNHKSIDEEIIRLFENAVGGEVPRFKVEVPVDLLLALVLREGFGRGRGRRKPLWQTIADARALEKFKRRAHELATPTPGKPGLTAGKARLPRRKSGRNRNFPSPLFLTVGPIDHRAQKSEKLRSDMSGRNRD